MSRALLDVNVLIAMLDEEHADHPLARSWLEEEIGQGWASCALTQNGVVRILSQPRYPNTVSPSEIVSRLREATDTEFHEFWPCDLSLLDVDRFEISRLHGPKQVTDVYLLALAVQREGRFVTFDRAIPLAAVRGVEPGHLVLL